MNKIPEVFRNVIFTETHIDAVLFRLMIIVMRTALSSGRRCLWSPDSLETDLVELLSFRVTPRLLHTEGHPGNSRLTLHYPLSFLLL